MITIESLDDATVGIIVKYPNTFTSETLLITWRYLNSSDPVVAESLNKIITVLANRDKRRLMSNVAMDP